MGNTPNKRQPQPGAAADDLPGPMEVLRNARAQLEELTGMAAESVPSGSSSPVSTAIWRFAEACNRLDLEAGKKARPGCPRWWDRSPSPVRARRPRGPVRRRPDRAGRRRLGP